MYMCTEMHVGNVFQKTMQSRQLYDLKLHASLLLEVYLCPEQSVVHKSS